MKNEPDPYIETDYLISIDKVSVVIKSGAAGADALVEGTVFGIVRIPTLLGGPPDFGQR